MLRINKWVRKIRKRVFSTPTTNIEISNALMSFGFSSIFILTGDFLVRDSSFSGFKFVGHSWIWLVIFIVSIIQFLALQKDSLKSNQLSAWLLKCSGFFWGLASVLFGISTTLNPFFFVCAVFSTMVMLAAYEIDERNLARKKALQECKES